MKKRLLCGLSSLLLLCAACTQPPVAETGGESCTVYFVSADNRANGGVLAAEDRFLPDGAEEIEGLLALLLGGPEDAALRSPFPAGISLRGWSLEDGTAYVDLSEGYGGLSGVELTLADGCVVLTLCQLEGVEAVYLTVEGRPRPFRDQIFVPGDFLLDNALPEEPQEIQAPAEGVEEPDGPPAPTESGEES